MKTIAERIKMMEDTQAVGFNYEEFLEMYKKELRILSDDIVDFFRLSSRRRLNNEHYELSRFGLITLMTDMDITKYLVWYLCDQGMSVHKYRVGEECKLYIGLGRY